MQNSGSNAIALVGGIPSHYMRRLHVELERRFGSRMHFFYIHDRQTLAQRGYERGSYPVNSKFLEEGAYLGVCAQVFALRPRLIVLHGHYPLALASLLLVGICAKKRIAYWSDTNIRDVFRRSAVRQAAARTMGRVLLSRAFGLMYVGTMNLLFYEWLIPRSSKRKVRLYRVPYPHCNDEFEVTGPATAVDSVKRRILYVGRLVAEKNVAGLLYALAILRQSIEQWECRVVGDGPEREKLEGLAQVLGLSELVTFAGAVTSEKVAMEFSAAHILVLPSHQEPWGLVVNEALSAGVPVVASRTAGASVDLVHDGITGFRVNPDDPREIAAKIEPLLAKEELRETLGRNGREQIAKGLWSLHGAVAGFEQMIRESDDSSA